ncbi:MAG: pyruvate kinase [Planctomycetota bacterium]|nr:pyruvate kinase [Planctomycetota bacterium]
MSSTTMGKRAMDSPPSTPLAASTLTKIIATVGPASSSAETIGRLIEAGASIFRLNFGHGSIEEHAAHLKTIRSVAAELGRPVAVLGDLQGPKIRVGEVAGRGLELPTGSTVIFQRRPIVATPARDGNPHRFSSTYSGLIDDVKAGQRLLVDDGMIRMLIVEKGADEIRCTVTGGGVVKSHKGVNLPDTDLTVQTLDERDWWHVHWAIENDLDFLALSFVRNADDVRQLAAGMQRVFDESGRAEMRLPIIAKIEVPKALQHIEAIVEAADGIMIARGDLGVEMDLAQVPVIQKRLVAIAQEQGKPCVVATQMLQSMIREPAPTRAEANDVANAIIDRADAVMLSGETAVGLYPDVAVEHMRRIALHTEEYLATLPARPSPPGKLLAARHHEAGLAHGVWTIAHDIDAKCIVVWSQAGGGARYLSQNNFSVPIIAVTSDERAARQMQLLGAVTPMRMDPPASIRAFTAIMDRHLQKSGRVQAGDACLIVAGEPLGASGVTDSITIHTVGTEE